MTGFKLLLKGRSSGRTEQYMKILSKKTDGNLKIFKSNAIDKNYIIDKNAIDKNNDKKLKFLSFVTAAFISISSAGIFYSGAGINAEEPELDAKSAILMEAETRTVLYEYNADEALPPASVTKVMTLLLTMEAIDSGRIALTDIISVSENAASMGGSQVYLQPGEQMSVEDMIKCVVISSANDAAVALAEFISGSEEGFVSLMNTRAAELGMNSTHFENTNGLDDTTTNHVTSARDIAIMSAELLSHPKIIEYSSTWMDSIRGGEFTLANTNKLIRFYDGATGLKTGSTSKAGFCISATAKRNDLHLIAVIMGSTTRDARNASAKKLLDIGFAGYSLMNYPEKSLDEIRVVGGTKDSCSLTAAEYKRVIDKNSGSNIEVVTEIPELLNAPIEAGTVVGRIVYKCGDTELGESAVTAAETVDRIGYFQVLIDIILNFFMI